MHKVLSSQFIYIYKDKFRGSIWGATNMRVLARKSGIPYERIRYWFSRQRKNFMEMDGFRIDKMPTSLIFNKNDK